jgi:translation initiation factor 2 gamma subunit (eIF-2gamma)
MSYNTSLTGSNINGSLLCSRTAIPDGVELSPGITARKCEKMHLLVSVTEWHQCGGEDDL